MAQTAAAGAPGECSDRAAPEVRRVEIGAIAKRSHNTLEVSVADHVGELPRRRSRAILGSFSW